ncbi:M20 family metallopeptidase [Streptomyces sp. SID13666]|uniref:M20 family metallopeptidase n=1 Tax=unclassified Streptomyces TaxID=2593676 RepID=UPI0013BFA45B|nr:MULTISPECIES: M20 family metallopeptidase [unclassified Streptomyces]NEA53277.1 M20 family metallopeptidase [Streptomyces sp. SID13666]NEA69396.1 M20 family metallopeptidase [Streptomyces sp. SID13588]
MTPGNTLIADIERLVRCESPSEDLEAVARSAEVVAAVGAARLGAEPERVVIDGRTHLRWRFGDRPKVLVLGHHDTVWPIGSLERLPFGIRDGVMRGPGCFDMKAGLVMAFHAVAALDDRAGVTLLITGDEEPGSPTSRELIEEEARGCDAVLVLEAAGPGGALKTERKGVSRYEIRITGRAAHAGLEPEKGVNAALESAHQIVAVAALSGGGTTVTPTRALAGTTVNTVPGSAVFEVDVRTWTQEAQVRVHRAMLALRPHLDGAEVEVTGGPNRPPLQAEASKDLFELARRLAPGPLTSTAVGGASDGNLTAGIGIPTLDGLGAVGGGAHADDEHVIVGELPGRTRLLMDLLHCLLGRNQGVRSIQADQLPVSTSWKHDQRD